MDKGDFDMMAHGRVVPRHNAPGSHCVGFLQKILHDQNRTKYNSRTAILHRLRGSLVALLPFV
jgi:hypothetical protein